MRARIEEGFKVVVIAETEAEKLCLQEWQAKMQIPVSDLDRILDFHLNPRYIRWECAEEMKQ